MGYPLAMEYFCAYRKPYWYYRITLGHIENPPLKTSHKPKAWLACITWTIISHILSRQTTKFLSLLLSLCSRSMGKDKPKFKFPVTLDIHVSTSYNLNIAYLIVNYGSYEESYIAFPVCSCLHFAINIFPPICNSEAVTLTLKLMAYIMLLFHYSARFLKNMKSPFCRCSHSLTAELCLYSTMTISVDPHPPPQQAAVQKLQEFHLNYLSPEPFITYRLSRWKTGIGIALLIQTHNVLTATSNQAGKAEEQMSLERTRPETAISEPPSATMPGRVPERSGKEPRPQGQRICLSSMTQPESQLSARQRALKGEESSEKAGHTSSPWSSAGSLENATYWSHPTTRHLYFYLQ